PFTDGGPERCTRGFLRLAGPHRSLGLGPHRPIGAPGRLGLGGVFRVGLAGLVLLAMLLDLGHGHSSEELSLSSPIRTRPDARAVSEAPPTIRPMDLTPAQQRTRDQLIGVGGLSPFDP